MSIYIRGNNPIKSIFYRGKFISKGYTNANNIVKQIFTNDIVTITINPIDESGNPITGYTITFFNYGVGVVDNNSITVKSGTSISYTINKDNYFMKTVTNRTVNQTETITETLFQEYTFTINPTPSDATVVLDADDPQYVQVGNSIKVPYGTLVNYNVSKTGYTTSTGFVVVTNNDPTSVVLTELFTLTVNPTPSDATVTFSTGTISGNNCTVPNGTIVTYTVSKANYFTKSDTLIINNNITTTVTLDSYTIYDKNNTETYSNINDTINVPVDGKYRVTLIGAGALSGHISNSESGGACCGGTYAGGSGALIDVDVYLYSNISYSTSVGRGGYYKNSSSYARVDGYESYLSYTNNGITYKMSAGGGHNGNATSNNHQITSISAGTGGTYSIDTSGFNIISTHAANNGADGIYVYYRNDPGTLSAVPEILVPNSSYNSLLYGCSPGYGQTTVTNNYTGGGHIPVKGYGGYIKITYLGQ